jgi:hypothetical protein
MKLIFLIKLIRFLAAQRKESNAWLHAFPSRNIAIYIYGQQDFTNMSLMGGVTVFNTLRPTAAS